MAGDITSELSPKGLNEFGKDFSEVMRVYSGINDEYSKVGKDTDRYIDAFRKAVAVFNKKYKNLVLKVKTTAEELKLRIFVKEKTVKDVFVNVASKLNGLKAIGLKDFGEAKVEEADKFSKVLDSVKNKLFISYLEQTESSVFLEQRKEGVELHPDEDIGNSNSPGFKVLAYYAVKDIGKGDVCGMLSGIGFTNMPLLDKVRSFLKKFNPRIGE